MPDKKTEYDFEVLYALRELGIQATYEWPGCVVIPVTDDMEVWTGLHGFEYGSINRLVGDTWEPDDSEAADVEGVTEESTPLEVAEAWATWVHNYLE